MYEFIKSVISFYTVLKPNFKETMQYILVK